MLKLLQFSRFTVRDLPEVQLKHNQNSLNRKKMYSLPEMLRSLKCQLKVDDL